MKRGGGEERWGGREVEGKRGWGAEKPDNFILSTVNFLAVSFIIPVSACDSDEVNNCMGGNG